MSIGKGGAKRLRRAVIAAILIVVAGVTYGLYQVASGPARHPAGDGPLLTRFSEPHFVKYKRGGEREWSLKAEVVEEAADGSGAVNFERITEGVLFDENEPRYRFVADRGVLTPERNLRLIGNVIFFEGNEVVFETEEVIWQADSETVLAPGAVRANYDGQSLTADRLEARLREDTVTLSGNVVWVAPEGIEVRADAAVYVNERLQFTGGDTPVRVRLERESSSP